MDTIIFMIYKTYIYTLSDSFGNIRYVGKTDNPIKRLKTHIYESKKLKKTHKHNWILSLLNRDESPQLDIIDYVDFCEWEFWEEFWICQIKNWGFNLTNSTKGGEGGNVFYKLSEENKNKFREKTSRLHKGKKRSKETCDKIKNAKLGNKNPMYKKEFSEYHKKNISESLKKFYTGNKNINYKKTLSNDIKEKISKNNAKHWLNKKMPEAAVQKISKKVLQYSKEGTFMQEWKSMSEAERVLGIYKISDSCNFKSKTSGNFIWRIKEDDVYPVQLNVINIDKKEKKILQYSIDGKLIKEWNSIKSAEGFLNIKNISYVCNNIRKSAGGFKWEFK